MQQIALSITATQSDFHDLLGATCSLLSRNYSGCIQKWLIRWATFGSHNDRLTVWANLSARRCGIPGHFKIRIIISYIDELKDSNNYPIQYNTKGQLAICAYQLLFCLNENCKQMKIICNCACFGTYCGTSHCQGNSPKGNLPPFLRRPENASYCGNQFNSLKIIEFFPLWTKP